MLFYRMGAIDRVDQLAGSKTVRFRSKRWTMSIGMVWYGTVSICFAIMTK